MVGRLSAGVARHRPGDGYAERCGMQKVTDNNGLCPVASMVVKHRQAWV
jgi:hypothetical protein